MKHRLAFYVLFFPSMVAWAVTLITNPGGGFPWSISSLVALAVGAVLVWKVPENAISWLLLVFGSVGALSFSLVRFIPELGDQDAAGLADAIFNALNTATVLLFPIILLRFPEGEMPAGRWRVVEWGR